MTGILIAFTGWMFPIAAVDQTGGTCVAHGVANVATILGIETKPQTLVDRLGIDDGYDIRKLPSALPEYNISHPRQLTSGELAIEIMSGPLIGTVLSNPIKIGNKEVSKHTFAVLGKSQTGIWIFNSWGTGFGRSGYGIIDDKYISDMWFQKISSGSALPSHIVIERKLNLKERVRIIEEEKQRRKKEAERRRLAAIGSYNRSK